jgi:hypothetical protein
MPSQDRKTGSAKADRVPRTSKRRLEQLARIWERQTGRKIVVA